MERNRYVTDGIYAGMNGVDPIDGEARHEAGHEVWKNDMQRGG